MNVFILIPFFFITLLLVAFCTVVGMTIQMSVFSKQSIGKKILPERKVTSNTLLNQAPLSEYCPNCGKSFNGGNFCFCCGLPRQTKMYWKIPIDPKTKSTEFESILNEWFAENPYVKNVKLTMETQSRVAGVILSNRFRVDNAVIEYDIATVPQNYQYGVNFAYKRRFLGNFKYNLKKFFAEWQENNMDCTIVSTHGSGKISHYSSDSGNFYEYYGYILFKKQI